MDIARSNNPGSHKAVALLLVLSAFSLLCATAEATKIYKWVDENGITQYTQYPPPEKFESSEIRTQIQRPEEAQAARDALRARVDALDERRSDKKLAQEEGEEAVVQRKELEAVCESTRKRLSEFESGRRLAEKQDDGSFVPVSEERRTAEIAKMQKRLQERCQ